MKGHLKMSKKEAERVPVLESLKNKKITQKEAGKKLNLCERQIRRIYQKYIKSGIEGLIHKNRGRISNRKIDSDLENKVTELIKKNYSDFGPTLAQEKLLERDSIDLRVTKIRNIMIANDIWKPRSRKNGPVHSWRPRRSKFGELVQMDGSEHCWFEDRGPKCTLMGYIDDATSNYFGLFYDFEGTYSAMHSLKSYVELYGIPENLYMDRHSTYKTNRQASVEEELRNEQADTQFVRVLKKLGATYIPAYSPQAKGRIENSFGTLQDRLIKELRLQNISTIEKANIFLINKFWPEYNKKFKKIPKSNINAHKKLSLQTNLEWLFSIKDTRTINNGYTIRWNNHVFLLTNPVRSLRKKQVFIEQNLDGKVRISTKQKILAFREITSEFIGNKEKVKQAIINIKNQNISDCIVQLENKPKKSWMSTLCLNSKAYALK